MTPSLEAVATRLGVPADERALCVGLDEAMQDDPAGGLLLLDEAYVTWAAREVFLTDQMAVELAATAARVAADEALLAFFWYCRHRVLTDASLTESWEPPWPALDACLGADAGLLNVLVMLAAVPEMLAVYARLGIPADIYRDTICDLRRWMEIL